MYDEKRFRMDGKLTVVVGAGAGIGRASAFALSRHGAQVICATLEESQASSVVSEIREHGGQAEPYCMDVRDESSVTGLFRTVDARFGTPHVVVVTPGVNVRKAVTDYSSEEFDRVVLTNLKGTFMVMREAGKRMARQGAGSIIALSSIRSQTVEPGQSVYAATKAGVSQLVRAMAAELGGRNVRVNAVAPGMVETALTKQIQDSPEWYAACARKTALGRWASPDEVAAAVVFLASDASSYVTGSVLFVDGGWTALDGRFDPPL